MAAAKSISLLLTTVICLAFIQKKPEGLDSKDFYIKYQQTTGAVLLDVREIKQFNIERIPGAKTAASRDRLNVFADSTDAETPVFIYCEENTRSNTACIILLEKGFKNVYFLKGGLITWRAEALPMDKKKIRSK